MRGVKDFGQDSYGALSTASSASMSSASMSSSLLDRLVARDPEAWKRIVRLYYPLVRGWCQRYSLQAEDAADVSQEVFRTLSGNVGRFRREGGQNSFRGWLHGITHRQLLAHWRQQKQHPPATGGSEAQRWFIEQPEAESDCSSEGALDASPDDRRVVLRRALELLREGVTERTWQAFWRTAVEGETPADVAGDLGMSVNAVYVAKARMLARLREEFGDLIE
jgi:RNA polymerase sigma-70 factor, ECF subfamily